MDIDVFEPNEFDTVFRVLATALHAGGDGPAAQPDAAGRVFLDTYGCIVGHPPPPAPLRAIDPGQVVIAGPHARRRLVQLAAIAALLARPLRPGNVAFVTALARALAVRDGVTDVLRALLRGRARQVRLLAMRRAMRAMLKESWTSRGPLGPLALLGAMFLKLRAGADALPRYRRLGLLAENTLGRSYWRHMTECGFGFPGEPGGIADTVAYHDVAHVLSGYDTTPAGEIQQGSFQAGNRREDGFFFVQFVLLHFHHGIRVTPGAPPATGHFDPRRVLWAIHRGARCSVDMTHQWDFWPLMPLRLDEARQRCGLLPQWDPGVSTPTRLNPAATAGNPSGTPLHEPEAS